MHRGAGGVGRGRVQRACTGGRALGGRGHRLASVLLEHAATTRTRGVDLPVRWMRDGPHGRARRPRHSGGSYAAATAPSFGGPIALQRCLISPKWWPARAHGARYCACLCLCLILCLFRCRCRCRCVRTRQLGGYRDLTVFVLFEGQSGLRIIGEIQVPRPRPSSLFPTASTTDPVTHDHFCCMPSTLPNLSSSLDMLLLYFLPPARQIYAHLRDVPCIGHTA